MDFFEIVNPHLSELTKNEQALFDYVASNLNEIKNKSIREVAEDCFVSTTTFLRFVRKIGFSGYSEFVTVVKYTLLNKKKLTKQSPFVVSQKDYREEYLKNLVESVRVMDSEKIKQVVKRMKKSPKIFLFAKGMSKEIIGYIKYLYTTAGFFVIFPEDQQTRTVALQQATSEDLVFMFSYRGEDTSLLDDMRKLKQQEHPLLVSITGADNNLLQNISDINLYLFTDELYLNQLNMTSHISMVALMELLLYQYIEECDNQKYHLVFR
ncbi:MAG: MurR/RpiR family transcriptional regulator [Enterococcus sp.]